VSTSFVCGGLRCRVMSIVLAGLAGTAFGVGLVLSGMTTPAKVIGFLDLRGAWDPSLGLVMAGAIAVYAPLSRVIRRARRQPWFDGTFHLPTRRDLDGKLAVGAAIFGIGWGLGGLCPGPGVVAAAAGSETGLLFVAAMLVGMLAQHGWVRR
jgi:uncharacterized membrane protein YedE/YeeE